MNIIPVLKCRDLNKSIFFYTQVLDFEVLNPGESEHPYRLLVREDARLDISAGSGDGCYGSCVVIEVDDVDAIFKKFTERGLDVSNKGGVHGQPTDQSWGMRDFYVDDPDHNTLRFGQEIK